MKLITWDTGILAAIAIILAYSLLLGKHKSLATLVSTYIAYVMASAWGEPISAFFAGDKPIFNQVWIKANASPFLVQSVLMIVVALLLSTFLKLGSRKTKFSTAEVILYSVSATALAIVFVISFMNPAQRDQAMQVSRLLPIIY